MEEILKEINLEHLTETFLKEKITPNVVGMLSISQMQELGINERSDMMTLRFKCLNYGYIKPVRNGSKEFEIPKHLIQALIESNFPIVDISTLLLVSESTIYRKMRQYNLSKMDFDDMDDHTLDGIVKDTIEEFPRSGEVMLGQILRQKNIKVPRFRLRDSLHRLDEDGIQERSRRRLRRRVYNVAGVNHLWHIDTNHKLIRWRFIIVGGIDGFSRFITFLHCTDNNTADTIFKCFDIGVKEFGLPLRVRSDKGMENFKVAEHMLQKRGNIKNCMIAGKSTNNQRIERLWRDVFEGVLCFYYDLFYFMEDNNILDVMNDLHIYVLHHVYMSKINEKLTIWKQAWATHRIRTIKTSPLRLFSAGVSLNPVSPPQTVDLDNYGVEGSVVDNNEDGSGRPMFQSPAVSLNNVAMYEQMLNEQCPKDWTSSNYGIDVFVKALRIVERL